MEVGQARFCHWGVRLCETGLVLTMLVLLLGLTLDAVKTRKRNRT
jgi:hypothetical protein